MRATVAICTWNRAQLLDKTLRQMALLEVPEGVEWEVLVANNNCTDNTDEVIARHADRLPIRRLFQPKPGKSNALNLASAEAAGKLILWTDDDVLVDRFWLAEHVAAARQWPAAVFFGGPIDPWFEGEPPSWLLRVFTRVSGAFAANDLGVEPIELTHELMPYGANFAVRRSTQIAFPYDTAPGPRPRSALRGEECDLVHRLLDNNLTGRWVPRAQVRHFIPKARQTVGYLHHSTAATASALP